MKVLLPPALADFVSSQVKSGEYDDASAVVSEAVRLMRETRERNAMEEMRVAFAGVDGVSMEKQASAKDRLLIDQLVKNHRSGKRRA